MKEISCLQVHVDSQTFIFVNVAGFLTLLSTTTHSVLQICIQEKVTGRASTTFRLNKLYKRYCLHSSDYTNATYLFY